MSRTVVAYQPRYFPRLHYLARARAADVFVIYDGVEFSRRSRQHRAPIDYYNKDWLTVPVRHTGTDVRINEALIDMSDPWPIDHLKTLRGKYGDKADEFRPFYERLCPNVISLETLRAKQDEVARRVDAELVAACLELDDELRARRREYQISTLRERKERLGQRIADRKRLESNADVDDLIARSRSIQQKLVEAEGDCRRLRNRRDRTLLKIAASLDDSPDFNTVPIRRLWEYDAADPSELFSNVKLVDLTVPLLLELFRRFEIESAVVRSSELPVDHPGDPSEYLALLTAHLDGDRYLTGDVGYENYLDETPFRERGQEVIVQDWSPTWKNGNVCALDVLYDAENPGSYLE